jgi:ATP-dependent DNA helicase RecG
VALTHKNALARTKRRAGSKTPVCIDTLPPLPERRTEVVRSVAGMRREDLGTKSLPRNPLLFNLLHRMHIVENIGSGYKRIHDAVAEYGMKDPIIEVEEHWFTVTFPRPEKMTEKTPGKATEKATEKTTEKILAALRENPQDSATELAKKLGISYHTIDWNFRKLRKQQRIRRVGPDKGGHWEVVDK